MSKIILGIIILLIGGSIAYYFMNKPQTPAPQPTQQTTETETMQESAPIEEYTFEFIEGSNGGAHVVVASQTHDVREQLPIRLEYLRNGQSVWTGTIEGDPTVVCRGATGCSMDGPTSDELNLQSGDTLEVVATGQDGTVLVRESALGN